MTKHVVHFSGGVASWAAARRVADRFGTADLILLFADTLAEDQDLYRFLDEGSANIGVPVTRLCDGRTPRQVFKDERFLGNSLIAPCSKLLKQKVLDGWHASHLSPDQCVIYLGMDWTEGDRHERAAARLAPYQVVSPLAQWKPYISKASAKAMCIEAGLRLPQLYEWAHNNNCGGLCVRGGQAHWVAALANIPERFAQMESFEEEMRAWLGDVSILRDRRQGHEGESLPLSELRSRIEGGRAGQLDLMDWGACGCDPQLP